jgi:hypothetical protein
LKWKWKIKQVKNEIMRGTGKGMRRRKRELKREYEKSGRREGVT